ncbi:probable endochitinase [Mytilus edulis]|uniref:probable endochitinase n=1 Tax=Mytilus edulis TaxID=6550 RepID=UPI0039F0B747
MNFLYFLFIVLISLCYTYGENSFSGHVCSRKIVKYRTSYYCSCKRLWWCCGRSARNTAYYTSEMVCCPGWMHTGDKNCSTAIVVKSQQNTTEALSQDNTTTEVGRTFLTSTQLLTSEEVTTMLPATTMEFNTNDDMSTTSSMTTPLEENDEDLFQDITSTVVGRTGPTSTETMTSEETTTMFTATTEDFKTNDDITSTSAITTTRNNKQTKQPQVEGNGSTKFVCPEKFGYFPDSTDCTKFYLCSWNDEYSFDCPPGTHWNQTITTCDFGDDC